MAEAAERLGTTERYPRRLVAERRIVYVKFGPGRSAPIRIPEAAIDELIAESTVDPIR